MTNIADSTNQIDTNMDGEDTMLAVAEAATQRDDELTATQQRLLNASFAPRNLSLHSKASTLWHHNGGGYHHGGGGGRQSNNISNSNNYKDYNDSYNNFNNNNTSYEDLYDEASLDPTLDDTIVCSCGSVVSQHQQRTLHHNNTNNKPLSSFVTSDSNNKNQQQQEQRHRNFSLKSYKDKISHNISFDELPIGDDDNDNQYDNNDPTNRNQCGVMGDTKEDQEEEEERGFGTTTRPRIDRTRSRSIELFDLESDLCGLVLSVDNNIDHNNDSKNESKFHDTFLGMDNSEIWALAQNEFTNAVHPMGMIRHQHPGSSHGGEAGDHDGELEFPPSKYDALPQRPKRRTTLEHSRRSSIASSTISTVPGPDAAHHPLEPLPSEHERDEIPSRPIRRTTMDHSIGSSSSQQQQHLGSSTSTFGDFVLTSSSRPTQPRRSSLECSITSLGAGTIGSGTTRRSSIASSFSRRSSIQTASSRRGSMTSISETPNPNHNHIPVCCSNCGENLSTTACAGNGITNLPNQPYRRSSLMFTAMTSLSELPEADLPE